MKRIILAALAVLAVCALPASGGTTHTKAGFADVDSSIGSGAKIRETDDAGLGLITMLGAGTRIRELPRSGSATAGA